MAKTLTPEQLEALRRFDAPTVANAIETFNIQPRNTGFMSSDIRCMYPDLGVMVGYACTAIIAADHQPRQFGSVGLLRLQASNTVTIAHYRDFVRNRQHFC